MQDDLGDYLRAKAQECMMLARSSSDIGVATGLRAIAHDLIRKAANLDDQQSKDVVQLD